MYAFRSNGQVLPGWPVKPLLWQNAEHCAGWANSWVAGRGRCGWRWVPGGPGFRVEVGIHLSGRMATLSDFPTSTTANVWAAPTVADTDRDGRVEIWVGGTLDTDQAHGYLWRFTAVAIGVSAP